MQLRPYQRAALDACWAYLRNRDGNPALVLPTGAGKSPLMAAIAREAHEQWQGRVGILAHVQELVEQNAAKLRAYWPEAPMGIYAAGLKRRDRFDRILFCQIQSVATRASALGRFDLLLVDEAHRIPLKSEGRYRQFIADCRRFNPNLRVVGLTATPYRLQGQAVPVCGDEHILTEVAYEARIPDLIADGYLSPLVSKAGDRPSLEGVHTRGGEYVESELAAAMMPLVERTIADLLQRAHGRRAGIVFCVNVAHAEAVLAVLRAAGEAAALVTGETGKVDRAEAVAAFQSGALRWLVNVNVLSEGFDAPHIDCVAMLRPTKSPGLYYQQVGRGFRMAPGKENCLVVDYAGNTLEHGPVDAIRVRPARGKQAAQVVTARAKECPACAAVLPLGARVCECGHVFGSQDAEHLDRPVNAPILSTERERVITKHAVHSVRYERGVGKGGKPDHLRAIYQCGLRRFTDYVCLQHGGRARMTAMAWWQARSSGDVPRSVEEALPLAYGLPTPAEIEVDETEKYPRVIGYTWPEPGERAEAEPVPESAPAWLQAAVRRAA